MALEWRYLDNSWMIDEHATNGMWNGQLLTTENRARR